MGQVTDPDILAQLNSGAPPKRVVTDPAILAQLNAKNTRANKPVGQPREGWLDMFKRYASLGGHALASAAGDALGGAVAGGPLGLINSLGAKAADIVLPSKYADMAKQGLPYRGTDPTQIVGMGAESYANKAGLAAPVTPTEHVFHSAVKGAALAAATGGEGGLVGGAKLAASGASSGGASEAVKQMGFGAIPQIAAGLIAGSPTGAASLIKNASGELLSRSILSGEGGTAERAAKQLVAHTLSGGDENAVNSAVSNIENAPTPTAGVKPTLAEASQSPGLAALQRSLPSTALETQMAQNSVARAGVMGETLGGGDPSMLGDLARRTGSALKGAAQTALDKIGLPVDLTEQGTKIRGTFETAYDKMKAMVSAAGNDPELNAEHPLDVNPIQLRRQMRPVTKQMYGNMGGTPPPKVTAVIQDATKAAVRGKFNTQTLTNLQRRLNEFSGELTTTPSESKYAGMIGDVLANHVDDQLPENYKAALDNLKALRSQQGSIFEEGPVADALSKNQYNRYETGPAVVPGKVVQTGAQGADTTESLINAIGAQPTEQASRAYLRYLADNGGVSSLKGADFNELTKRFPFLESQLNTYRQRLNDIDTFGNTPLGAIADRGINPSDHIQSLLSQPGTGFEQLQNAVLRTGDQKAIGGFRQALADHLEKIGIKGSTVGADLSAIPTNTRFQLRNILDRTQGTSMLDDNQRSALEAIHREMQAAEFARTGGIHEAQDATTFRTPFESHINRVIHFITAYASNRNKVTGLLRNAISDPSFAADLLKRQTPDRMARLMRTIRSTAAGTVAGTGGTVFGGP